MIEILKCGRSAEEKLQAFRDYGINLSAETIRELVDNFEASPQLEDRLNKLIKPK